jgi:hypothetical protein
MQWKVSSSLATITSLLLLSAGDLVVAQVSAPLCTEIVPMGTSLPPILHVGLVYDRYTVVQLS